MPRSPLGRKEGRARVHPHVDTNRLQATPQSADLILNDKNHIFIQQSRMWFLALQRGPVFTIRDSV